ncbi:MULTISPECIES: extensin family protein [Mesorhizobium]|nr:MULTISPECIES: extensin family protein [Mesorhizobium]RXT34175.1 extensin family protein [Mesorhizobium erdmanii]MBE1706299.1 extensin family protein [Mesorhizobium japonicum]MBE1715190.1 extensin family protein [Mesorhizobium japonicum]OBP74243.1 extensin family protein [Mesorhizobium loti]OBP80288.1 extensin family protein [Mesorhizobium loti]
MDQSLTQRLDQPLRQKGKHRGRSRGKQQIAPRQTPQETQEQQTSPADIPVPEPRPTDAPKADAAPVEEQKSVGPKASDASNQLNEEKARQAKQAHPEPSARESSTREPSTETESEPESPAEVPIPTQRPDTAEPEVQPPAVAPQPPEKPAEGGDEKMLPDPRSADRPGEKMPAGEVACRDRLKSLGVEFEEHGAESNPEIGCSIPYPLVLKSLGKSIAIAPGTELNCPMAEAAARFAADVVQPEAKAEFGADLKSISQASAFVCRPRHGTRKLSEHAFGNALDIAGFTLSDGRKVEVGPTPPEGDAKFLNAVRKAACGPFKTVLGPGADADHALHFHLDLEPRRHGGTFCQ